MPPRRTTNRQPTNQVIDVQSVAAGRIPPHNRDAEVAVLGACLIDSQAMGRIVDRIRSEDFYDLPFQTIYAGMRSLYDGHRPIDLVTLADELTKNNQLDSVGGHAAIAALAASVATAGNIVTYAEIVRHRAMLRRLMNAASTIGELAFREEIESEKLVDEAEQALYAVTGRFIPQQFVAVKSVLDESFERINQLHSGGGSETRGVPSGFSSLDGLLGGFQKSDLVILAARPSMGKTAFALNIAEHAAVREKKTVGIFSMEMAKEQLVDRLVSSLGRIDSWKLRNGYLDDRDFASLNEAYGSLADANLFIDDSAGSSVTEVRAKARRLQSEHGLDMLIVDYLQLMKGSVEYGSDRTQEVSEISRSLKALAKELQIPIIALSQLSRAVESRPDKRPMLSDLRESGGIEQDADIVMFLYRDDYYNREEPTNICEVLIRKHRNGPTGDVKLLSRLHLSRFENLDLIHGGGVQPPPE